MTSLFNTNNLTPDQQRLLTRYINQYNQTNMHIDLLLDMLDEIRGNIVNVINLGQTRRTRINRHSRRSNANINRVVNQILNDRQDRFVHYNYDNPINPNTYHDFNFNNIPYNTTYRTSNIFTDSDSIPEINQNININANTNRNRNRDRSNLQEMANFLNNFFDTNVTIRPTSQQIENASRIIRYSDINNPLSETCPISLDNFNQDDMVRQLLPCGHIFHQEQFNEWFSSHVRCPVCRYDIRDYRQLSRRHTPNSERAEQTTTPISNTPTSTPTNNIISDTILNSTTINSTQPNNDIIGNFNITRDPSTNAIDQLTFDVNNSEFTNNVLNTLTRNIFNSILNPQASDENERFMIDPSNNILFYETIIRPPNSNSSSGNRSNNNS